MALNLSLINSANAYVNLNECKSFNVALSTNLVALESFRCSEVIIINKTGQSVYVYDSNNFLDTNRLLLETGDSVVLRGVTNSAQISCKTAASSGNLYYRTQNFSILPQI